MSITKSRWTPRSLRGRSASLLPPDHLAVVENRTVYRSTVVVPVRNRTADWVLKHGSNSRKIGGILLKGKWKGFPVYTLTLEERLTCPATCEHWRSCYGNHMQYAMRWVAGRNWSGVWRGS